VTGLSIDLTIPALIDDLFEAYGVDEDTREDLTKLLQKRDRDGLDAMSTNISGDIAKCFVGLLDASGVASDAVALLDTLDIPETGKLKVAILKDVYHSLSETLSLYCFHLMCKGSWGVVVVIKLLMVTTKMLLVLRSIWIVYCRLQIYTLRRIKNMLIQTCHGMR